MSKSVIWTLQNPCPTPWIKKISEFDYNIQHHPLIQLQVNDNFPTLIHQEVKKYDTLIISSPFSAQKIASTLKDKFKIFAVGEKATEILKDAGHSIIRTAHNSEELVSYIKTNIDAKILHLCSEKSDVSLWPINVDALAFYAPIPNLNFNIDNFKISSKTIIVFGSPSGVDVWFKNDYKFQDATVATMGKTTAQRFTFYTERDIITPKSSTTDDLCQAIYNHITQLEYERTE